MNTAGVVPCAPPGLFAKESGITPPDSRVNIFTTTTDTDLLTQVYDLVGVPAATVPEPPAWTLLGAGLLALGFIIRQRIKDRAHPPS